MTYGIGDFFGGIAAKRARTTTVVVGSLATATVLLGLVMGAWALLGDLPTPSDHDLLMGLGTGLTGPIALGCLYRGLAIGRMSVVAPITAVVAAVLPLCWGLASGERPSAIALAGAAVALVAVGLISGAPAHEDHPPGSTAPLATVVPLALIAGAGFGAIYILLGSTSDDAGLWPLVVARPVAVTATAAAALVVARRGGLRASQAVLAPPDARLTIAAAGVLDITANAIYLAAANAGLLSIVAVVSSLYPAATVVLARVVLGERVHRLQVAGLVLAVIGIVAMATG